MHSSYAISVWQIVQPARCAHIIEAKLNRTDLLLHLCPATTIIIRLSRGNRAINVLPYILEEAGPVLCVFPVSIAMDLANGSQEEEFERRSRWKHNVVVLQGICRASLLLPPHLVFG